MVPKQKTQFEFKVYLKFPVGSTVVTFHDQKTYKEFTNHYKNIKEFIAGTNPEQLARLIKRGNLSIKDIHTASGLVHHFNKNLDFSTLVNNIKGVVQPAMDNTKIAVLSKGVRTNIHSSIRNKAVPKPKKLTREEQVIIMVRTLLSKIQKTLAYYHTPKKEIDEAIKALKKPLISACVVAYKNNRNVGVKVVINENYSLGLHINTNTGTNIRSMILSTIPHAEVNIGKNYDISSNFFNGKEGIQVMSYGMKAIAEYTPLLMYSKSNGYRFALLGPKDKKLWGVLSEK